MRRGFTTALALAFPSNMIFKFCSNATKHISIITLSILLSLYIRSTLSIPLKLSSRNGQDPSMDESYSPDYDWESRPDPPPNPNAIVNEAGEPPFPVPSKLDLRVEPWDENTNEGCDDFKKLILEVSLKLASQWAAAAYDVIEHYSVDDLKESQGIKQFLSPDNTTPSRSAFRQHLADISREGPQGVNPTWFQNNIKEDAKMHLLEVSRSLGKAPLKYTAWSTQEEPFVFTCYEDQKIADKICRESNKYTRTGMDDMALCPPFFDSVIRQHWPLPSGGDMQGNEIENRIENYVQLSIEEDKDAYENAQKAKSNGEDDADFPLPMNPVYMLLRAAQHSASLLRTYRETDDLEDLLHGTPYKTKTTTKPIVDPKIIKPEDRSHNAENWALIAWLNKIGHLQNLKSETDPKAQ